MPAITEPPTPEPGMGQCSVTGKWVPEDELITLRGQAVCAEGKQILLDRLKAGEGAPGALPRPGYLRRWGCLFLDNLILLVPLLIADIAFHSSMYGTRLVTVFNQNQYQYIPHAPGYTIVIASIMLIDIAYFALLHARGGRTVGKMAGGLRVVTMQGEPISSKTAVLRAFAFMGPFLLAPLLLLVSLPAYSVGFFVAELYGVIDGALCLTDRKTQRTLHDRLTGTRVIMVR